MNTHMKTTKIVAAIVAATLATGVYAQGGTAKPPAGTVQTYPTNYSAPLPPNPAVSAPPCSATSAVPCPSAFTVTGFLQAGKVDSATDYSSGTVTVNGITYTVPANSIIQMPASTVSLNKLLSLSGIGDPANPTGGMSEVLMKKGSIPALELTLIGNYVYSSSTTPPTPIVGLAYVSQQSLNSGQGYITGFDYANGVMYVGAQKDTSVLKSARVQINDPVINISGDPANGTGRYSKGQSPDIRFMADQDNPTIHAETGYPMCIPRVAPTATSNDPLCPQKNRPVPNNSHCRNFFDDYAGFTLPKGGDIPQPVANDPYCRSFVMPAPPATTTVATTGPDSRLQAPFEIGDFVTYAGTLITDSTGTYISAHTIDANVGIFTSRGTLPVYIAIGEFRIGAPAPLTAINGAGQEATDRLVLESSLTDPTAIVDVYLVDKNPAGGKETHRWITPWSMTGELMDTKINKTGGGIRTQYVAANIVRARIRANKAPADLMVTPTRNVRVVVRQLCGPESFTTNIQDVAVGTASTITLSEMVNGTTVSNTITTKNGGGTNCLQRNKAANGLYAGQYLAPVGEFIFPENVKAGDPVVPNNLWDLSFLYYGDDLGTRTGLSPLPW